MIPTSRKLHRWISVFAMIFFLVVSVTGVILQGQQIFGKDEQTRERLAQTASPLTLSRPLPDLLPKLEAARQVLRARYGNQPVSRIDWQIKGDKPLFIFHIDSAPNKRVEIDIRHNSIVAENSDEEPFLLRLHTGEALGDGGKFLGLFCGASLVLMIYTGLRMYLQVYQARKKTGRALRWWQRFFWTTILAFVLPVAQARAGSPFLTDDPGFAAKGWEIKEVNAYEKTVSGETVTAPVIDINYTVVEHFKVNLTLAAKQISPNGGQNAYGMTDTDFKFKWRFLDEQADSWIPAMSIAPNITLPTADQRRGLGDGAWRLRLPVQIGKTFGKWYVYGESGYQIAFDDTASDVVPYGAAAQYAVSDRFSVGAELNGGLPVDKAAEYSMLANTGFSYVLTPALQLQASLGRTLRDTDRGGSEVLLQTFLQWNFD